MSCDVTPSAALLHGQ